MKNFSFWNLNLFSRIYFCVLLSLEISQFVRKIKFIDLGVAQDWHHIIKISYWLFWSCILADIVIKNVSFYTWQFSILFFSLIPIHFLLANSQVYFNSSWDMIQITYLIRTSYYPCEKPITSISTGTHLNSKVSF